MSRAASPCRADALRKPDRRSRARQPPGCGRRCSLLLLLLLLLLPGRAATSGRVSMTGTRTDSGTSRSLQRDAADT